MEKPIFAISDFISVKCFLTVPRLSDEVKHKIHHEFHATDIADTMMVAFIRLPGKYLDDLKAIDEIKNVKVLNT
jgi:hypothetical protein